MEIALIMILGFILSAVLLRAVMAFMMYTIYPEAGIRAARRRNNRTAKFRSFLRRHGFKVKKNNALPYLSEEPKTGSQDNDSENHINFTPNQSVMMPRQFIK